MTTFIAWLLSLLPTWYVNPGSIEQCEGNNTVQESEKIENNNS